MPIDIRVQPDSMERVVELLGGRHIYGRDHLAPLRELIQNARDAIELRNAIERAKGNTSLPGSITVTLERQGSDHILKVRDNGIGMTKTVVRKHLVGVGSDFWNSSDFYREYSAAIEAGFRPIGKFGIGFLSVFMFGNDVQVETETAGNTRIQLTLRGVGRRGELCEKPATGQAGTEVRITLKSHISPLLEKLSEVVRTRAPMLSVPITVTDATNKTTQISPGWWKAIPEQSFLHFVRDWTTTAFDGGAKELRRSQLRDDYSEWLYRSEADFGGKWTVSGWPVEKPHYETETERLICMGGEAAFGVVRCSQGIAVDLVPLPDICGMVEVGPADLVVSREAMAATPPNPPRHTIRRTTEQFIGAQIAKLRPAVVSELNRLASYGMVPGRINFIRGVATIFGLEALHSTSLAWIPLVEPPGNLIHRSRQDFIERMAKYQRLLLATGVSMASSYSLATRSVAAPDLLTLPVLAIGKEEVTVEYSKKNELERAGTASPLKGSLDDLRAQTDDREWHLVLCKFILECLAEAWSI
ncbi:MAG: ATP-binding protein, partial [Candidatus Acidiferrales bacterium]